VRQTNTSSRSGSTHNIVEPAPRCPKVRGENQVQALDVMEMIERNLA